MFFSVNDLLKIKEELTKERDELLTEVVTLRNNLTKATASQQEMEVQKEKAMETISQVMQKLNITIYIYRCLLLINLMTAN